MNERAESSASELDDRDAIPGSALSAALVEARQARGLTQSDVADQLYLPPELIRQIDESRFASISKPAYIKGYLRSYARLVGLPGDELVNQFDQVNSDGSVAQGGLRDVTEEEVGSAKLTGPVATTGLYGLGGIVLIFVLVWIYSLNEGGNGEGNEEDIAAGTTIEASGESIESGIMPVNVQDMSVPVDDTSADGRASESMTEGTSGETARPDTGADAGTLQNHTIDMGGSTFEISSNEEDWTTLQGEDPGLPLSPLGADGDSIAAPGEPGPGEGEGSNENRSDGQAVVVTEVSRDGSGLLISVQANGPDHLNFTLQDDCWIEVTDANGRRVYGDLNHGGDEVDLFGLAPFRVLVGRAQAVTIMFNDQPVELEPNTLNNTARLNLGN